MRHRTRRPRILAATFAAVGLVAACTPGAGNSEQQDNATATTGSVNTAASAVTTSGTVTLTVWDQEVRGGQAAQIKQLNAAFEKKFPTIKINRVTRSFDDLGKTLKLALSGKNPPDVFQMNNGYGDMGAMVKAKRLVPLDKYAKAYNWSARYPKSILQYSSYSVDGTSFGSGALYGLPQVGEVVGIYVNTDNLKKAGVSLPTTWEGFQQDLATVKQKIPGQAPMVLGDLDKTPAIHMFGPVQAQYVAPDKIRKLAFGQKGGSWNTPENTQAAQTLVDWMNKGYIDSKAVGMGYDPAWQAFSKGKGTYLMTGSWLAADLGKPMSGKVRFVLPPKSKAAGDKYVTTGGTGIPWAISSKSKNADQAAAYINFITSPEAMKILAKTDNLPIADTKANAPSAGLNKDVFTAFATIVDAGGLVPYLDYATPTMEDTLGGALQDLLSKKKNPQQFLAALQADYGKHVGG